jgi:hypothetical protein
LKIRVEVTELPVTDKIRVWITERKHTKIMRRIVVRNSALSGSATNAAKGVRIAETKAETTP